MNWFRFSFDIWKNDHKNDTDKLDSWPLSEFDWNSHENVKTDKSNTAAADSKSELHTWSTTANHSTTKALQNCKITHRRDKLKCKQHWIQPCGKLNISRNHIPCIHILSICKMSIACMIYVYTSEYIQIYKYTQLELMWYFKRQQIKINMMNVKNRWKQISF